MVWMMFGLIVIGTVMASLAIVERVGSARQRKVTADLAGRLLSHADKGPPCVVDLDAYANLPAPVERYLRHVLQQGQPHIRIARLVQSGELRTDVKKARWMRFDASHLVVPAARGFVWDARVGMAPLIHVRVRDAFVDAQGFGQVALLSAFIIASDAGTPEMSSGALHRYLAEAVWYPTALLPSAALHWTALDEHSALAVLTMRDVSVSLEFRFNDRDEVTGIFTPQRWGRFGSRYRQAPWEGFFRNYKLVQGMRVPSEGEVAWYVEEARQSVWKGKIADARYEMNDRFEVRSIS